MSGFLRIITVTANGMLPVASALVHIKNTYGQLLHETTTNAVGETEYFALDAPDKALSLDPQSMRSPYSNYDVEVSAYGFDNVVVYNVKIADTISCFLKVVMHPVGSAPAEAAPQQSRTDDAVGVFAQGVPRDAFQADTYDPASPVPFFEREPFMPASAASYPMFQSGAESGNGGAVPVIVEEQVPQTEVINITPEGLLIPSAQQQTTSPSRAIREVFIPEKITVHLGHPNDASAQNVTVPFIEYIANVASSEIYPTWPENALIANIHCITTFALNRVYTEWYRSRNFPFDITSSTAYDQYFIKGRNIYDNIYELASTYFNVYARLFGFRNPFFTQYCNGTTTTCAGLSQWGTVPLAQQGYTPLQILHHFFPDDLELIATDNIRGIQQTFPGTALRIGSSGPAVQKMQNYLNRIRVNFPLIPLISMPNGIFDEATDAAVRAYQRIFNLTVDGIIGKATWNSIAFTYFGVIKVGELISEGERVGIGMSPPTSILRMGARGRDVNELQFILNVLAAYYDSIPTVIKDSYFGFTTQNAVIQFQKTFSLREDGIVGPATWNKLYEVYRSIAQSTPTPPNVLPPTGSNPPYPGSFLRLGSEGSSVSIMQTFLNTIRTVYPHISTALIVDGEFGEGTRRAVVNFQQEFQLVPDGIIGPITWNKIVEIFNLVTGGVS